ncbi:MAG: hypothetical protein AB1758_08725 [Candidatus Eremiobacterota bacterium]
MISRVDAIPSTIALMQSRPADTVGAETLYTDTDTFIAEASDLLAEDPRRYRPVLEETSRLVQDSFHHQLTRTDKVPDAATCKQAALNALQAGLLAGAIDATILFILRQEEALSAQPRVAPSQSGLPDRRQFARRTEEILAGAAGNLRDVGPWAIAGASRLAKNNGAEAVEQASGIPDARLDKESYRNYLLTCFMTGYSAAALSAAFKAGPRQRF